MSILLGILFLLAGSEIASATERIAPFLQARQTPLQLFVREIDPATRAGAAVRIVRYGQGGGLDNPGALELPEVGRAFVLHSYDLLIPGERDIEVRHLPQYDPWLRLSRDSWVIPRREERIELIQGTVLWQAGDAALPELELAAGDYTIRGQGTAEVRRVNGAGASLTVRVMSGRFEVSRQDQLVSVPAAGQERRFDLDALDQPDAEQAVIDLLLQQVERSTLELFHGELTGDRLEQLEQAALQGAAVYARSAVQVSVPGSGRVPPDVLLRYLGDALRILSVQVRRM